MREGVVAAIRDFPTLVRQPGLLIPEHLSDYRSAAAAQLPPLTPDEGWALDGRKKDVKLFMWEHSRDWHGGVVGPNGGMEDYDFSVASVFKKCLDRQVEEGLRILECEGGGGVVLNSKN